MPIELASTCSALDEVLPDSKLLLPLPYWATPEVKLNKVNASQTAYPIEQLPSSCNACDAILLRCFGTKGEQPQVMSTHTSPAQQLLTRHPTQQCMTLP